MHTCRFIASVNNNGHCILQPPLNYQVFAQNIRAADVLSQHDIVNSEPLEPQERGLSHVVDISTARRRHSAQSHALRRAVESNEVRAERLRNMALRNAATRADNLPFHNFGRRDIMPELHDLVAMNSPYPHCQALKFEDEKSFKCCQEGYLIFAKFRTVSLGTL